MSVRLPLTWVISAVLVLRISSCQGTSCSDCMADVTGPYQNLTSRTNASIIDLVKINEAVPAVFYCSYTCQDNYLLYSYKLDIHIVYDGQLKAGRHKLHPVSLRQEAPDEESTYNCTVRSNEIVTCNVTNNVTTFEIQISVNQVTPILVPQCVVVYNSNECSNLNTFVIIPTVDPAHTTEPGQETPSQPGQETTTKQSETTNDTVAVGQICLPEEGIGSGFGILGTVVATETAILLTLLIICLFNQCKKNEPQLTTAKTEVIENNATCKEKESKATNLSPQQPPVLPHQVPASTSTGDGLSSTTTVSTISNSVLDTNNLITER